MQPLTRQHLLMSNFPITCYSLNKLHSRNPSMASSQIKIFLLTSNNHTNDSKLVWAENEEKAKEAANIQTYKIKNTGDEIPQFTNDKYSICKNITDSINNITTTTTTTSIHFNYSGKKINLVKDYAKLLSTFNNQ